MAMTWLKNGVNIEAISLDSGSWSYLSSDLDIDLVITVADSAEVSLIYQDTMAQTRKVLINLGSNAKLDIDILDLSKIKVDQWTCTCQEGSILRINHIINMTEARRYTLVLDGAKNSEFGAYYAIQLSNTAVLHHNLKTALKSKQLFRHRVHGSASQQSKGVLESFVHIPDGADASSYQSFKTFSLTDRVQWQMQPDLVIDHNNVIAKHGACHGLIDNAALLYAKSRGLNENTFKDLYYRGFLLSALTQASEQMSEYLNYMAI